jgi:iron complex transport system substrate-binding protein
MRIVSLFPAATEILYALGAGERIVAVSHECNYPTATRAKPRVTRSRICTSASSLAIDAEAKSLLACDESLYLLDADLIERLAPNMIITQAQCDVCAVRYADVVDLCRRRPSLCDTRVLALNPASLADVLNDIGRIAGAAGIQQRGKELIAGLNDRLAAVRELIRAKSKGQPRVVIIEWLEPVMAAGNWTPELVQIAGGLNGLSVAGNHSVYHDWDEVVAFNPEVVVVAACGFNLERTLEEMHLLARRPRWQSISAVQTARVFAVDGDAYFNRPGPRLVDSVEMLAALLHPGDFPPPNDSVCQRWTA